MRTMMVMWPLHSYVHNQERQGALPRMKEDQFFDGENHGVVYLHGRSCSLFEERCQI